MQIQKNYSLKNYNTFHIDAYSKYFSAFHSTEDLQNFFQSKKFKNESILILGGGSNILFTKNFDGVVLKNETTGMETINEDEKHVYVKVAAGEGWHRFVMYCVERNLAGIENLSLIPGYVGAAPMQNIGAYGVEIKDVFHSLEALHILKNKIINFTVNDCEFGYRDSAFKKKYKNQFAILNVTFRLNKIPDYNIAYGAIKEELNKMNVDQLSIQAISDAVINIRTSKLPDPKIIGNAGSFFKNPEINSHQLHQLHELHHLNIPVYKLDEDTFKIYAGWLIEQCGPESGTSWKGYRKGNAGCYDKQALVLVNYGNATGKEIYKLSEEIKISVKEKFGIELEREVNII